MEFNSTLYNQDLRRIKLATRSFATKNKMIATLLNPHIQLISHIKVHANIPFPRFPVKHPPVSSLENVFRTTYIICHFCTRVFAYFNPLFRFCIHIYRVECHYLVTPTFLYAYAKSITFTRSCIVNAAYVNRVGTRLPTRL